MPPPAAPGERAVAEQAHVVVAVHGGEPHQVVELDAEPGLAALRPVVVQGVDEESGIHGWEWGGGGGGEFGEKGGKG